MDNIKLKPTVAGKAFKVEGEDSDRIFYICKSEDFPDHFVVIGWSHALGTDAANLESRFLYLKTTVWEQIDRKQWIIQ